MSQSSATRALPGLRPVFLLGRSAPDLPALRESSVLHSKRSSRAREHPVATSFPSERRLRAQVFLESDQINRESVTRDRCQPSD